MVREDISTTPRKRVAGLITTERDRFPRPALVPRHAARMPLLRGRDVFLPFYLSIIAATGWLVPPSRWEPICLAFGRFSIWRQRSRGRYRERFETLLGARRPACPIDRVIDAYRGFYHLFRLQGARAYRPFGWHPRIVLEGREQIERALERGKGAILWVAPMFWRDLVAKMALHEAGFPVTHLSRFGHNLAHSRIGARLFNPIWTRLEDRYLAERLTISRTQSMPIRALIRRLTENRIVSITATNTALRVYRLPFLAGAIGLAGGAAALAASTGAALLPLVIVRTGDGGFRATIEPPLATDGAGSEEERVQDILEQYARRLESYALSFPCDYEGWNLSGI